MKKCVALSLLFLISVCGIWGAGQSGAAGASSDQWPTRPVQIIVGNTPGSDTDFYARAYATRLDAVLGRPVVVTNVPGANGAIGAHQVLNSAPDGYNVMIWNSAMLVAMAMETIDFGLDDFEMSCIAGRDDGNAVAVNVNSPYHTLRDLLDDSARRPGQVTFATPPAGNTHVAVMLLNQNYGAALNPVDMGGTAERAAALLGGHVHATLNAMGQAAQYRDAGQFRLLAVLGRERNSVVTDVPTAIEQGIDVAVLSPFFFAFPKGTPQVIVDRFTDAVQRVNQMPEYQEHIRNTLQARPVFIRGREAVNALQAQYNDIMTIAHLLR